MRQVRYRPDGTKRFRFCECDSWEWCVIFFSIAPIARGVLYVLPQPSSSFVLDRIQEVGIPLWVWAAPWIYAGVWAIVSVYRHRRAHGALLAQCGLFIFWGSFYFLSAIGRPAYLGWTCFFLVLAGVAGCLPRLVAVPKLFRGD